MITTVLSGARRVEGIHILVVVCGALFTSGVAAQVPSKVDFEKEVLPIFQENCTDCHGPSKQKAGLRLDRKSSVLKAFSRRVIPGSSANSMVYHRLIGNEYGIQMPPTGELRPEKVAIIKAWIDQGAEWPDTLSNEMELPPFDPKAVALVEALRRGDLSRFMTSVEAEPALLNARGPEGSTPFMYAVLYAPAATLARLLQLGADPNQRNDANASALMWAARDLDKTRLLVKHGADVNAKSDDRRTALMIAARRPGAARIVKFLLANGADPNPNTKAVAESSPLMEALTGGDERIVELLLRHGADAKAVAEWGLTMAVVSKCQKSLELLAARISDTNVYTMALQNTAVLGDLKSVRLLLDRGAEANAYDPFGRTPLMYAAISDVLPLDVVKLLVERGADVNARNQHTKAGDAGLTVLEIARNNGHTPIVDFLVKCGAKGSPEAQVMRKPRQGNTIQAAVRDSLPLLQRTDFNFSKNAGCTSCHNNSMEAMVIGLARKRGVRVDEEKVSTQVQVNVQELQASRDKLHQGYFLVPVGDMFTDFVLGYQLVQQETLRLCRRTREV